MLMMASTPWDCILRHQIRVRQLQPGESTPSCALPAPLLCTSTQVWAASSDIPKFSLLGMEQHSQVMGKLRAVLKTVRNGQNFQQL